MEVHVSKSAVAIWIILAVLMVLCDSVVASEQIELSQCSADEDHGPIRQCVVSDTTGGIYYEGEDATVLITVDLPLHTLHERFWDENTISIVAADDIVMVAGREIRSKQDKGRWLVEHSYMYKSEDNHVRITITLHITSVNLNDHQILHVEISGSNVIYMTAEKIWINVKTHNTTEDLLAMEQAANKVLENEKLALEQKIMKVQKDVIQCNTTLDIAQAKIEDLENEKLALEQKIMKVQKDVIQCNTTLATAQAKIKDLENDKLAQQNETEKYKKALQDAGESDGWDIATCFFMSMLVIAAISFGFILRSYSLKPKVLNGARPDQWTLAAQEYAIIRNNLKQPLRLRPTCTCTENV